MTKYRNPRITPNPLFVVDGLPPHIDLIKHDDCFILRCGKCGTQARHGLPVTPAWLRRIAHDFKDKHRHSDVLPAPSPAILDTLRTELLIRRGALDRSLNGPVALPATIAAIEWCKLDAIKAALEWIEAAERAVRADDSE